MTTLLEKAVKLKSFFKSITDLDNIMKIYFVTKSSNKKYISFQPQVSNQLQEKILAIILPNIIELLKLSIVKYNPVGVADEENELLNSNRVETINEFMQSIEPKNLYKEMDKLIIKNINFYCIEVISEKEKVYLFRQFTKMSKIRKGILSQFVDDELKEMDNNFLGIDPSIDMILYGSDLFIFNHISLERIFNYRDEFLKITNAAIGEIVNQGIMRNIDEFSNDCQRDVRIMKRFTALMSKERLPLFFEHYDKVKEIVDSLNLDIEFDEDGKIIYRERSQLFHIINLMSDAYFKSLLSERFGVAKTEEEIN